MPSPNKKVNQVEISPEERCFATLIASGLWTQAEAHRVSFKDSKLKDDSQRRMLGSNMAKRPQVIAYIQTALLSYVKEKNKGAVGASFNFDDLVIGEDGAVPKEYLRKAIIANISSEADTSKKQKMIMDLATLDGRKGDTDTGSTDDKVMFYTPVTCASCHLYKAEKEKKGIK